MYRRWRLDFADRRIPVGMKRFRPSKPQEKPSALKREHPALQNMKFLNFLWVIFVLLDRDPDSESGPIRIRSTG
jgi:hypothetical protein